MAITFLTNEDREELLSKINEAASSGGGLERVTVDTLPTTGIKVDTVYLVPAAEAETNDQYDEYVFIPNESATTDEVGTYSEADGSWEVFGGSDGGSGSVDLTEVNERIDQLSAEIVDAGNEVYVLGEGETLDDVPDEVKVVYEMPDESNEGGGETNNSGGTDIALGITGAAVGQIARITAVDEAGVPTAWEAVDMASEGKWKLLNEFSTSETVAEVEFTQSDDGVPYNLVATMAVLRCINYEKEYDAVKYVDNNVSLTLNNVVLSARRGIFKTRKQFGTPETEKWWASNSNFSDRAEYSTSLPLNVALSDYKNVTGIKLSTVDGQLTNWEIKIWGVEA